VTKSLTPDDILAVVPARGGSKGIPRKNLHPFRGQPLIRYTLDALSTLSEFTSVIVSTEDAEIRDYCASQGFVTDYVRPDDLAGDSTPIVDVLLHAYEWATAATGRDFRYIMLLQPTSPLRTADHIRDFTDRLLDSTPTSLVSVSPMTEHPMECLTVREPGQPWEYLVEPPTHAYGRQAYRGEYFFINGAMYGAEPEFLRRERTFLVPGLTELFVMPQEFSLDIDTPEDLLR
jgi:N-acylneuraminate cytidylyltransferase/CMP-N,N'-diacetyllegionaminic acid synthase